LIPCDSNAAIITPLGTELKAFVRSSLVIFLPSFRAMAANYFAFIIPFLTVPS